MKDMIIKLCQFGMETLAYIMAELKAGNLAPMAFAALGVILLLDKDFIRVILILILILILIVILLKVVMK